MADFVKNAFVKKGKYGTKFSVKVDAFIKELEARKNESGYVNMEIKTAKDNADKLYVVFDDWKPPTGGSSSSGGKKQYPQSSSSKPSYKPKETIADLNDDLPF